MNSQPYRTGLKRRFLDYLSLLKPRITMLSLVTTFAGMWLAAPWGLEPRTILFVLLGTGLGAGSASALNNYLDRNLDGQMSRTRDRPLPQDRLPASHALALGTATGVTGVVLLSAAANLTAGVLLLFSICFYNGVYTLWMKHQSRFATEISGVAGALAPVIGWVSVTGRFGPEALILFGILFTWQPGHFWALGIKYVDDYRGAGLPRYPVVRGVQATKYRMLAYVCLLVPLSIGPAFTGLVSSMYLLPASVLGAAYLGVTVYFVFRPVTEKRTLALFGSSVGYLFLLFSGMLFFAGSGSV